MSEVKQFRFIKPTIHTPLHIDFDWWKKNDSSWHVYLNNYLCLEHRETFANAGEATSIDWIDPDTAEVQTVDGVQHILMTHCALEPDFITPNMALVDAVFRIFLANGNIPLTAEELGQQLSRPAETIVRTLLGMKVYKGIRPYQAD